MARRYRLPVWMTPGTFHGANYGSLPDLRLIDCHAGTLAIGDLSILPYPVPHDSREPCQFVFSSAKQRLGVLTDVGHITPHIVQVLHDCDALVLEFNHDPEMLVNGPYPQALKVRVGGIHGHLSNLQALQLLKQLSRGRLGYLIASHISEKNNSADLVVSLINQHLPELEAGFRMAAQHSVSDWFPL
jgi:phosphoribosyl 1,2-cyclic phosphodiesterase